MILSDRRLNPAMVLPQNFDNRENDSKSTVKTTQKVFPMVVLRILSMLETNMFFRGREEEKRGTYLDTVDVWLDVARLVQI